MIWREKARGKLVRIWVDQSPVGGSQGFEVTSVGDLGSHRSLPNNSEDPHVSTTINVLWQQPNGKEQISLGTKIKRDFYKISNTQCVLNVPFFNSLCVCLLILHTVVGTYLSFALRKHRFCMHQCQGAHLF